MSFISENYISIIVLSIIIFGSIVIFAIFKDKFSDPKGIKNLSNVSIFENNRKDDRDGRVVTIETFDDNNDSHSEAFCKKYQPQPHKLREHCKNLGVRGCHVPRCCVLLNGEECVPGDRNGPSFRTHFGEAINAKYFYFQGKCITLGEKCPDNL